MARLAGTHRDRHRRREGHRPALLAGAGRRRRAGDDRRHRRRQRLAAEIAAKHGRNSTDSMVFDVSDEAQCKALVAKTIERFGKIDILINNAALYAPLPTLKVTDIDVELWDKVMAINIRGPFLMVKHVAPHMIAKKYGKIVNIGSGTVARGIPDFSHYVTSKGAVTAFTRCMSRELGDARHLRQHAGAGLYAVRHRADQHRACASVARPAAVARRALKRDDTPRTCWERLIYLCSSRQRLHDRPGPGGRRRRQQHLDACQTRNICRVAAPLSLTDELALILWPTAIRTTGFQWRRQWTSRHATQRPRQANAKAGGNSGRRPRGLLRQDLQARHGAALGGAERHHPRRAEDACARRRSGDSRTSSRWCSEAGAVITAEEATRRVLVLENPTLRGKSRITQSLYAGFSSSCRAKSRRRTAMPVGDPLHPRRRGRLHPGRRREDRHGAGRFRADPVWAPSTTTATTSKKPMIWLDVLDVPTVNFFETCFYEHFDDEKQNTRRDDGEFARFAMARACCRTAPTALNEQPDHQLSLCQDAADPGAARKAGRHRSAPRRALPLRQSAQPAAG